MKRRETCRWIWNDDGAWEGSCGVMWWLEGGGCPADHDMHFCPRCGGLVKVTERQIQRSKGE